MSDKCEENTKNYKRILTGIVCFGHLCFGICLTILGQTLSDLKRIFDVDSSEIAYAFVIRSTVNCIGAVICGYVFNYFNRQILYSLHLFLLGCSVFVSPLLPTFRIFLINEAINGFCSAGLNTASSVLILEMWEKDSNPYLQAIHSHFAIGAAIGPLICAPFLSKDNEYPKQIAIPFAIAGLMLIASSVVVFTYESLWPYKTPIRALERKNESEITVENTASNEEVRRRMKIYNYVCVILGAIILSIYTGTEINIFSYLATFVYEMKLGITKQTASLMSATFGATFAVFRIASIFAATKLQISTMIYISLIDQLIAYLILWFLGAQSVTLIWVSLILIGAGCSCVYGSIYAFIEQRVDVTNHIASLYMFSSSFMAILWPFVLGNSIEDNAMIFVYVNIACMATTILLFIMLHATNFWKRSILNKQ